MTSKALLPDRASRPGLGVLNGVRRFALPALVLAIFFGVAAGCQRLAGVYGAELSGYPDEPVHFVTGVLVHDYLTTFPPQPVVPFAKEFYIHRPKVAIGHWPPVLYIAEALWFLLFHVSRASALTLMALIAASVAASIYHVVQLRCGVAAGIAAGLIFLCLGFTQTQTSQVMADMLVTLFAFWAVVSFADFLASRRNRDIFRFAAFALLSIFTKNNGLFLVLTVPLSIAFTQEFGVLRKANLWLASALVGVPSALWVAWSRKFVVNSWVDKPGFSFFLRALKLDLVFIYRILGPCLLILVALGIVRAMRGPRSTGGLLPPTLIGGALSVLLFQSLAPAGIESRFMLPAIAMLIPLLLFGLIWLAELAGPRAVPRWVRAAALLGLGVLLSPRQTFALAQKESRGFSEAADFIQSQPSLRNGVIVVSSSSDGEGLLISEIVMRYANSEGYLLRASKVLAQSDWLGREYKSRFDNQDDMFRYLERMGVDLLVLEEQASASPAEHQQLLLQVAARHPGSWGLAGTYPERIAAGASGSKILVYRRLGGSIRSDEKVHQDMQQILGRMLGE